MRRPPESDWRNLSLHRDRYLNALCERILNDASALIGSTHMKPHDRYLSLFKAVSSGDQVIADVFDHWKRSDFYLILMRLVSERLVSAEELQSYSLETQGVVSDLLGH